MSALVARDPGFLYVLGHVWLFFGFVVSVVGGVVGASFAERPLSFVLWIFGAALLFSASASGLATWR